MSGERLREHKEKLIQIRAYNMYSFPELLPKEFRGEGRDIRRDYNPGYFTSSFAYDMKNDKVDAYFNSHVSRISFEEFFEACSQETKEYILFNLDFFNPSK